MITAKQLRNTYPHKQMRMFIEREYPQAGPVERGRKLADLTRKFLRNYDALDGGNVVPRNVDAAFIWGNTPEGHDFWGAISDMQPIIEQEEIVFADWPAPPPPEARPAKVKPVVAKKKVGWW